MKEVAGEVCEAYALTEVIYETFLEMAAEGLLRSAGSPSQISTGVMINGYSDKDELQLIARGDIGGREVTEKLTRSARDGHFYLFTSRHAGSKRLSPHPRLGTRQDHTSYIEATLFMERFIALGLDRVLAASTDSSE